MTTPISAANVAPNYPSYDFKPSYNAVQLNLSQPTLNVPQQGPVQGPAPQEGQKSWVA
ncbi:MAG: hypothetical protein ACI4S3_08800 [Candidatus Gastranaerophilaceae bacterium]